MSISSRICRVRLFYDPRRSRQQGKITSLKTLNIGVFIHSPGRSFPLYSFTLTLNPLSFSYPGPQRPCSLLSSLSMSLWRPLLLFRSAAQFNFSFYYTIYLRFIISFSQLLAMYRVEVIALLMPVYQGSPQYIHTERQVRSIS